MPLKLRVRGNSRVDADEVRRALSVLADPQHGIQLQVAPYWAWKTFAGKDVDAALAWLKEQSPTGVYYALNPVAPGLEKRVTNPDPVCRRWLLVDVDRNKAESPDESATEEEHERARALAVRVMDHLTGLGWPVPVLIDSGNGFHLLYRVDLPNDNHAKALIRAALQRLAEVFDGEDGSIGKECHDARRISKLPGTLSQRGDASASRPHRMCKLLHCPEEVEVVTADMLQAAGQKAEPEKPHEQNGHTKDAGLILRTNGDDGRAYGRAALRAEVARVALATPGTKGGEGRNTTLFKASANMGELVAGGCILRQEVESALEEAARSCGLHDDPGCGERGIRATIRSGLDTGAKQPRGVPEKKKPFQKVLEPVVSEGNVPPMVSYRLLDLLAMELPAPNWAIPGLMSEGLTILAGKPKLGKSWMALNLALTIAGGGTALAMSKVVPGDVLYLALEDRLRRVQDRALKLLKGVDCEASNRLTIAVHCERQRNGGLVQIERWLKSVDRPTLVIIDVWQRFRPSLKNGPQYEQDYEAANEIKSLGDKYHASMLAVHHTKKAPAEDVVDEISGTLGLAGAADGTMILTRSRNQNEGKLFLTGRDIEEQELALQFDPQTFAWKSLGDARKREMGKVKAAIMDAYRRSGGAAYWPAEMAEMLDMEAATVRKEMWRLFQDGELRKIGGKYAWPALDRQPGEVEIEE